MTEIEIRENGELRHAAAVVGQITWLRPFAGSELAGVYDDAGLGYDEFGGVLGCERCEEHQEEIEELESEVATLPQHIREAFVMLDQEELPLPPHDHFNFE